MRFILGKSGTGKTKKCYEQIKKTLTSGYEYKRLIVIVPDQFTLQTQLELSKELYPGLVNVEVISFKNLARFVLRDMGAGVQTTIDDLERIMILRKVLEEHKKELGFFGKSYTKEGFIESINGLLTLFEQTDIDEESLKTICNEEECLALFKVKMEDICNIQKWFNEYIADKFLTLEGKMEVMIHHIAGSEYIKDSLIWIDGFYNFTSRQITAIKELAKVSNNVTLTLPIDKAYSVDEHILENNPFYESIQDFKYILTALNEEQLTYKIEVLKQPNSEVPGALSYLQQNYLKTYVKRFEGEDETVNILSYLGISHEIEKTAQNIKKLIRDEGYRYSDIGIIAGDLGIYESYIMSTFMEYEIPYFLDKKKDIHTHSLISMIQSILEIITTSWSYKSIMSFLRTYMTSINREEIDELENYLLACGIKGKKKWLQEWEYNPLNGIEIEGINTTRAKVVEMITRFEEQLNGYKDNKGRLFIKDATVALFTLLQELEVYDKIQQRVAIHQANKQRQLERENTQIWGQVVEVFERLVDILGKERVSISVYKNIVKTSLGYIQMAIIPPAKDQVLIGTIDRTRLPKIKALFVIGVNEGVLPKQADANELFSQMDLLTIDKVCSGKEDNKERLRDRLINDQIYGDNFSLYMMLMAATAKLYVSYVSSDEKGKPMRPSILFYKLKKVFGESKPIEEEWFAPVATFTTLGERLRKSIDHEEMEEETWKDTLSWYLSKEEWRPRVEKLTESLFHTNQQHYLEKETANLLYDETLTTSVSKLETFRGCACCYFIKYGLRAEERKLFRLNTAEIGQMFHGVLEHYPEELRRYKTTWVDVDGETMKKCIKNSLEHTLKTMNRSSQEDARLKYTTSKVERMSNRAIGALTYQLKQGEFVPKEYEVTFGAGYTPPVEIKIDETRTIRLQGQIDRVDVYMKEDGEEYIKIIDYKSGKKKFDLVELFYGLQLQLLLYLDAYIKLNGKGQPAGMFYFYIDNSYVQYEIGESEDRLQQKKLDQFKLSGLVLEDEEIIEGMDASRSGSIVPVGFTTKGAITKKSSVANEEQFESLRYYVEDVIKKLGREIMEGKVSSKPYKLGDKEPCSYCKYQSICQFDTTKTDNEYDVLNKLDKKEIWEKLCERREEK